MRVLSLTVSSVRTLACAVCRHRSAIDREPLYQVQTFWGTPLFGCLLDPLLGLRFLEGKV